MRAHASFRPAVQLRFGPGNALFALRSVAFLLAFTAIAVETSPITPSSADIIDIALLLMYSFSLLNVAYAEYKRGELASPLALFCYGSLLYFGLTGILYYDKLFFQNQLNREYYTHAILYVIFYSLTFHITYSLWRDFFRKEKKMAAPQAKLWRGANVFVIVWVLLIMGWIGRVHLVNVGVYLHAGLDRANAMDIKIANVGFWRFLETVPDLAGWIMWTYCLRVAAGRKSARPRVFYFAITLLFSNLAYWVPTATKLQIAQAVIVPIFIQYLVTRRLPRFRYIAVLGAFLAMMFPLTYMFRGAQNAVLGKGMMATGFSQVIDVLQFSSQFVGQIQQVGANGRLFGRLNEFEPVSGAVRVVNDRTVPLHMGQEYLNFFINLVPRFLWPGKPNVAYGNDFGHVIGILGNFQIGTSIAPTLVGESYMNFADFGVIIAALLATIYFFMYRLTWTMRSRETAWVLYATAIPTMLYMDASFALYFSGLFQIWVFTALLGIFMSVRMTNRVQPRPRFRVQERPLRKWR